MGALIALVAGFASALPFMDASGVIERPVAQAMGGGDLGYYVGMLVGGLVYVPLRRWDERRDAVAAGIVGATGSA